MTPRQNAGGQNASGQNAGGQNAGEYCIVGQNAGLCWER